MKKEFVSAITLTLFCLFSLFLSGCSGGSSKSPTPHYAMVSQLGIELGQQEVTVQAVSHQGVAVMCV